MIGAAIYARKSTDQNRGQPRATFGGPAGRARGAYARGTGWTVLDEHVYTDDAISGAEFERRPGFVRLMSALKPQVAFHVLVMSEESRLGREAIEMAYALKQLVQAGVQVWFYLEDRQRTLDSPMLSLRPSLANSSAKRPDSGRYDAMQRKARAGHVTGGRVFGYDNLEVLGPDGRRSHVERRINEAEAAVVRRIFDLCAEGAGLTRITKTLNADGVPAPRPQRGRPVGWAHTTVRDVLLRELYRGVIVWNQTRKRDRTWAQKRQHARPEQEWMRVPRRGRAMSKRAIASRIRAVRDLRRWLGHTRDHGRQRVKFYGCATHWKRGARVCRNGMVVRVEAIDTDVLATLADDVLRPSVITSRMLKK